MRAAVGWSYDLLAAEEQVLFRRLSIFVGGFTLEATSPPTASAASPPSILDGVASLVDNSLLRQEDGVDGNPRLFMLETVREYGEEQLELSGELEAARRSHAVYFLRFASESPRGRAAFGQAETVAYLVADRDNLRAAQTWMEASGEWEMSLQLASALARFWYLGGNLREGLGRLERAINHAPDRGDSTRAEALMRAGDFGWELGRYEQAEAWLTESMHRFTMLDDAVGRANCLISLGLVAEKQADDERAAGLYEDELAYFRVIDNSLVVAGALGNLADLAYRRGDWSQSAAYTDESIALARALGDRLLVAMNLGNLGQLALHRGDVEEARERFRDTLTESLDLSHPTGVADAMAGFAGVALAVGALDTAARLLGAAQALCERLGTRMVPHHGLFNQTTTAVRARLGNEHFAAAWQEGVALSHELAVNEALAMAEAPTAEPAKATVTSDVGSGLTARELEVLRLLVAGLSDRQIGEALFISWRTAQGHVAHICNKLGVGTRAAVVALALRSGLVTVDQIAET